MDSYLYYLSWYVNRNPIVESFYQGTRHRDNNNWGPRFGFNFAFTPQFTVHGGYGIYYDRITLEIMSLEKGFDGRALALNVTAGNVTTDQNGIPIFLNPDGTFRPGAPEVLSSPFSGFRFYRCRRSRASTSSTIACATRWCNSSTFLGFRKGDRERAVGEDRWRAQSGHPLHHRAASWVRV